MRRKWFAVQVYAGREKWIESQLARSDFKVFLPLKKELKKWSDRNKLLLTPLFPGYIFCHMDLNERPTLLATGVGSLRLVGCGSDPEPIPDSEIDSLQRLVSSNALLEPWPYLSGGATVRIVGGAFDGVTGTFIEQKKHRRIVVSVHLLQRSLAVELDQDQIFPELSPLLTPAHELIGHMA